MGNRMQRTLIPMGKGGLVVSIPKMWAVYFGLKAGDKVEVVTNDKLVIYPKPPGRDGITNGNNSK